ncbi:helix-turn-helix transcriptional regulator [Bacillus sp. DX1.1]|uniref:helix-turn-helix transcriptional regulator n=1 Tax=unclassified Bacillus (in: firmicutes) TaxID=185979 RepID=UPI002570B8DE|nr:MULTISPECIES: helix-turn-helix transcriptional regulator [unclassified Bacillus (in: firmicutes)]MDM5156905.1 helix-turn-helix transcriptional regulator [Bacillus sp. DX1.1]WJE81149.1 helix-turn-helix transcriptional regulator [Bacillus sp. DX3.1]
MSIGKIIYYHRKKQNKTQEQLCNGICSITHLSKIENNFKEAHTKTLQMLCERLQISIEEENKKTQLLKRKLDLFNDAMERLHKEQAAALYKELSEQKEYVQCTEMIYVYELYMLRYLLFLNQFSEFKKASSKMKRDVTKYSSYELYLWTFLQALYYGRTERYVQALEILNRIEEKAEQYSEKLTEYYYYRSAMHGHLYQYSLSIHYAYKALRIMQNTNNILRIVYIKMIIAVNLIYMGEFEESEQMLIPVLSDVELLQDTGMKAIALQNLGFLYYRQGDSKKMFEYYSQALELKKKHTTSYYVTVSSMAEALIELNQHEKAAVRLKQELDSFQDRKSSNYIELKIMYLEALGNQKTLVQYLIKYGLPMLEKHMNLSKMIKYLDIVILYYEKKKDISSANYYLQASNRILKKLLFNAENPAMLRNLEENN